MIGKIVDFVLPLSRRERVSLGLMMALAVPAGVWFGVLLPLSQSRVAADATLQDTAALHSWVENRRAEAQKLRAIPSADPVKTFTPVGLSGLEEGLNSANLRPSLSELGTEAGGIVLLRFNDVDFVRLATWITSSHPDWGYEIRSYRFETLDVPSRVSAKIELQAPDG
ncbi:MAG: type II secretion system protein GspM [Pelagimonas sp.]|uniref:type II secretion system protein GspM n=1 Tax=Pelagimonas sp. TaxID=2073170 RepID=UPI003D6B67AE